VIAEANDAAGLQDDELTPQLPDGVQNVMSSYESHRWPDNTVYYRLDNTFSKLLFI